MVNYQTSQIYKIESTQGPKVYIGSTTKQYLSQRMDKHRSSYKQWKEGKVNKVMAYDLFDEYGVENCSIILIESFSCNSKDELRAREGHHIKSNECVNKHIAGRSQKQWVEDNKDHKDAYLKKYYEDNKEELTAYKKDYREKNKAMISERQKKWREENKEAVNASQRERRRLRKEKQSIQ